MEKRGWITWFTRKTNKTLRQGVCTTYIGHRHLPSLPEEQRHKVSSRSDLRSPGKISRPGKPPRSRWEFSQKRRVRKNDTGKSVLPVTGPFLYFPGLLLYFKSYIEINGKYRVMRGRYLNHAFFLHSFWYTNFSGDLYHLLTKRPANILWPFLMRISQPENLFSPKVIFLKSGTTLWTHQIKLHFYRAKVQWAIIKKRMYLA